MLMGISTCSLCPHGCSDRSLGICGAPDDLRVASVCIHNGEEPPISPAVNVFFAHCNLHCIYCQNWQISGRQADDCSILTVDALADRICDLLPQTGGMLGFVTPTHYANQLPAIVEAVRQRGISPTVVYNSSGYESVQTLRNLEGLVDIYLPDFKYMDSALAARYSHAPRYPEVAQEALLEMIRQVGTGLKCADGIAYRGIIVRHLVLPGHIDNSLAVLDKLSTLHSQLSTFNSLHVSLMAQYYPPRPDLPAPLNRTLTPEEYRIVADRYVELGFDGWLQELSAEDNYRPDFSRNENPFE